MKPQNNHRKRKPKSTQKINMDVHGGFTHTRQISEFLKDTKQGVLQQAMDRYMSTRWNVIQHWKQMSYQAKKRYDVTLREHTHTHTRTKWRKSIRKAAYCRIPILCHSEKDKTMETGWVNSTEDFYGSESTLYDTIVMDIYYTFVQTHRVDAQHREWAMMHCGL